MLQNATSRTRQSSSSTAVGAAGPAAGGEALFQLDRDIAAVLATADTVIDFDPLTRDAASSSNG